MAGEEVEEVRRVGTEEVPITLSCNE